MGSRTLDPPLGPHQHEQKFVGAHACKVTFKHLPQALSFGTLGQLFKIPTLSAHKYHSAGGPQILYDF